MTDPDAFDDTTDDHEQFETELVAQDMDADRVSTADIDEETARCLTDEHPYSVNTLGNIILPR